MDQETKDRLVASIDKCCDRSEELITLLVNKEWVNPDDKTLASGIAAVLTSQMVLMQTLVIFSKDQKLL